jgi:hypothetical protein
LRTRRLLICIAAAGTTLGLLPAVAAAGGHGHGRGWVDADDGEIEVGAESGTVSQVPTGAGSGTASGSEGVPVCEWDPVPEDHIVSRRRAGDDDVDLWFRTCPGEPRVIVEVPRGEGDAGGPPFAAWERALELLSLPSPRIAVNPSDPVVHVETWLWVEAVSWRGHGETASAGGVTATVNAIPRRVVWDMGNGDQVVCEGPGAAYDPTEPHDAQATDCSYTYRHTSAGRPGDAYEVTATLEWEISWTVVGATGGGTLPAATTSTTVPVQVGEMQALNQ